MVEQLSYLHSLYLVVSEDLQVIHFDAMRFEEG